MKPPIPHAALVTVTGWPQLERGGVRIGRHLIQLPWQPELKGRVTVRAYPTTTLDGKLLALSSHVKQIRAARRDVNGATVRVTGQLIRLDRREGVVRIRVYPALANRPPFLIALQATSEVTRALDPGTLHVTVTGRVLEVGRGYLLAERIEAVNAPIPARWAEWKHERSIGPVIEAALERRAAVLAASPG